MEITTNGLALALIKAHLTFSAEQDPVIMRTVTVDAVVDAVSQYLSERNVEVINNG